MFHFNNAIKMLYKARYKTFYETLIKLKIKEILRSSFGIIVKKNDCFDCRVPGRVSWR